MQNIEDRKVLRILDANFNRSKEGLRVCEDICRFYLNNASLTKHHKDCRHQLTSAMKTLRFKEFLFSRAVETDVGSGSTALEFKRKKVSDIYYANAQRVKESIRVLEEFSKLRNKKVAGHIKKLRYSVYALEKKTIAKL